MDFADRSSVSSERFLEKFIDRYLSELREKLDNLKSAVEKLDEAGAELQRQVPGDILTIRQQWKRSLGAAEKRAGDMWSMLSGIFTALEDHNEFKPQINLQDWRSGFEKQQKYLNDQTDKVEERVTPYFFTSTIRFNKKAFNPKTC